MIKTNRNYTHYKGKKYRVLDIVKDSETNKDMVLYIALYDDYQKYVRPASMWNDIIPQDKVTEFGQNIRFKLVE
jgi:hypothetical protein